MKAQQAEDYLSHDFFPYTETGAGVIFCGIGFLKGLSQSRGNITAEGIEAIEFLKSEGPASDCKFTADAPEFRTAREVMDPGVILLKGSSIAIVSLKSTTGWPDTLFCWCTDVSKGKHSCGTPTPSWKCELGWLLQS